MALGAFKISSATMDGVEGKRAFETAIWTCQLLFGRFPFPQEESTSDWREYSEQPHSAQAKALNELAFVR